MRTRSGKSGLKQRDKLFRQSKQAQPLNTFFFFFLNSSAPVCRGCHLAWLPASTVFVTPATRVPQKKIFINEGSESKSKQEDFWNVQPYRDVFIQSAVFGFEGWFGASEKIESTNYCKCFYFILFLLLRQPTSGGQQSGIAERPDLCARRDHRLATMKPKSNNDNTRSDQARWDEPQKSSSRQVLSQKAKPGLHHYNIEKKFLF